MSPPAPPFWVPSNSPHEVCSGRGRLMVTSLQYCNEWVLPIPILGWFPLPPHSFVSCVGNGHVVLENHLLDNGSVLPSDRQGKLILKCLSGLKVIVAILRRALQGTVPNLKGDPTYSERGPKGDLILSKKGTKRGPKRGPKTWVVQKIEKRLHVEISQKLNLDKEKNMSVFCFHLNKPTLA